MNLEETYNLVKTEFKKLSAIYEGALIELVGQRGLNQLLENGLLKDVGLYHGRQMYVLIKK
jgi:hypothetical protein